MLDFLNDHLRNGMVLMIAVLLVLIIAYRYYSAFLAAKVLALDPARPTPAHTLADGQNYDATNKWVLFGHHFAAISGAGPLLGPVLAAQYGFLPGLLWILIGVVLAGAVQDFTILVLSVRRDGKSLAQIARMEIGPVAGSAATIGILFVLIIALAGLGKAVTKALGGETVSYDAGTQFVANTTIFPAGTQFLAGPKPIKTFTVVGKTTKYVVPKGTQILFPDGRTETAPADFGIDSLPEKSSSRVPLDVPGTQPGAKLLVPPDNLVTRTDGPVIAQEIGQSGSILTYRIPAGASVVYPNGASVAVDAPFQLVTEPVPGHLPENLMVQKPDVPFGTLLQVPSGFKVTQLIPGSPWGTFTIAMTIPIALLTGWYMYRVRKGRILEASLIGGLLTLAAVWFGGTMDQPGSYMSNLRDNFNLTEQQVALAMAIYGFIAAILPVWILLCPRDYLSAFLKIGTVALLVVGVILARPTLHAPAINTLFLSGGPVVPGSIFPFVFITIMCGAISGFHALVASGTTPKMLDNEKHARPIGYGAMLVEGLVGIVALIAASALPAGQYYHMQTGKDELPLYQRQIAQLEAHDTNERSLGQMGDLVHENLHGRTGGAVGLAIGMTDIFDEAARNVLGASESTVKKLNDAMPYWYHFAIMFEALFILTTIDAGTRVGRFLLQETMGKYIHPALGKTSSWPSAILATAVIVAGWYYFINAQSMRAIWPMFGIANQMLAVMALAVASVGIARLGKQRYLAVTLAPLAFVAVTTTTAAVMMLQKYFADVRLHGLSATPGLNSAISAACILAILVCTALVVIGALIALRRPTPSEILKSQI